MVRPDPKLIVSTPYPHVYFGEYNSPETVGALHDALPPTSEFEGAGRSDVGRTYMMNDDSPLEWQQYSANIVELLYGHVDMFSPLLKKKGEKLRKLGLLHGPLKLYASYLCITNPSRGLPFHQDSEEWALVGISNFGYQNGTAAPNVNLRAPSGAETFYGPTRSSLMILFNDEAIHGIHETVQEGRVSHVAALSFG